MSMNKLREKSPKAKTITLKLWNHGKYGETIIPTGNVSVFSVSGEDIGIGLLQDLLNYGAFDNKFDWFGSLPTEQTLLVEAEISEEECGYWLEVINYKEL